MLALTVAVSAQNVMAASVATGHGLSRRASTSTSAVAITSSTQATAIAEKLFSIPAADSQVNVQTEVNFLGGSGTVYVVNFMHPLRGALGGGGGGGSVDVILDAKTGTVLNYSEYPQNSIWDYTQTTGLSFAKGLSIARVWLAKLDPHAASLTETRSNPFMGLGAGAGQMYTFERSVSGIPVPFQAASVSIGPSGELVSYSAQWQTATFPDPAYPLWTAQAALPVYLRGLALHLAYAQLFEPALSPSVLLTYQPTVSALGDLPFVFGDGLFGEVPWIDAHTGQQLNVFGQPVTSVPTASVTPLVPGGQDQMPGDFKDPISQSEAIAYARSVVTIPKGATMSEGNLNETMTAGFAGPAESVWSLNWNDSQTGQNYSVTINSANGMLEQYFVSSDVGAAGFAMAGTLSGSGTASGTASAGSNKKPALLTTAQGQQVANQFVKRAYPTLSGALAAQPIQTGPQEQGPQGMVQTYVFTLLVHGILAEDQSVVVGVDMSTGQVLQCANQTGAAVKYPSPSGAVSLASAEQAYAKAAQLQLTYVLPVIPTPSGAASEGYSGGFPQIHYNPRAVLVFAPSHPAGQGMYNAETGQWVPEVPTVLSQTPSDIKGHYGEAAMKILLAQNLLPMTGGLVHPNQLMTRGEFVQILINARGEFGGGSGNLTAPYEDVPTTSPYYTAVEQAQVDGLLPAARDFYPNAPITRDAAAAILVNFLGWGNMAQQQSLFKLPFSDASSIPAAYKGDAAIANAYHMIPSEDGKWDPTASLTVAEASVAIVRTMQLETNG